MKKVLVTGSSGMLGSVIVDVLIQNQFDVYGVSRTPNGALPSSKQFLGDLCSESFMEQIAEHLQHPDIIIHTAAFVNLNFCEQEKELAFQLHVNTSEKLASLFPESTFIYISTDSVFDGRASNYTENDIANPLNYYAKTKYLGEEKVLERSKFPIVLRTNIYGNKKEYGGSLAEWAIKELTAGNKITGFTNVLFNPLYIYQVAEAILEFINYNNNHLGIFNLGCKEKVSKHAFVLSLAKKFSLNTELIGEATMNNNGTLERPLNTTLDTTKFASISINNFTLEDGLASFAQHFKT